MDLVYNPGGAFLPPPQDALRERYAEELLKHFDIHFNEVAMRAHATHTAHRTLSAAHRNVCCDGGCMSSVPGVLLSPPLILHAPPR
eukprot:1526669-Prymnesium_polylepis.1